MSEHPVKCRQNIESDDVLCFIKKNIFLDVPRRTFYIPVIVVERSTRVTKRFFAEQYILARSIVCTRDVHTTIYKII